MSAKPETVVYLSVQEYCFTKKQMKGLVKASEFKWNFTWLFGKGLLVLDPPLGRALIENAVLKFLLKKDYDLEAGSEYKFIVSSKF